MTHGRLRRLLRLGRPGEIVASLTSGRTMNGWTEAERAVFAERPRGLTESLGGIWARELAQPIDPRLDGVDVLMIGETDYPDVLVRDPAAPALLFARGDPSSLDSPRVGIIGTRNSTSFGRFTAREFARELAHVGVAVVSGLARGIDAAAHRGALDADGDNRGRPIAVVASGPDVVYPRENAALWHEIVSHGLLLSESPPGTRPDAFRFPLRNRITAALCDVLLVVESRLDGGSMITVREALARGVTVMAVPGSTSTRSAEGTNVLIRDGALVALEAADVMVALGLDSRRRAVPFDPRRTPDDSDAEILGLMGAAPVSLDDVAAIAAVRGHGLAEVALALGRLEMAGWISCTSGWFERLGPIPPPREVSAVRPNPHR
jgi:DNA processing protein